MADHVDGILAQWHNTKPELDTSPMAIFGRLALAAKLAEAATAETFADHGLDPASFDVLATLMRAGSPHVLTPKDLHESAMVTSSAVAQRLNKLEARGLVTRSPNGEDGRVIDVALTEAGKLLVEAALPDHLATEHKLLARLDSAQREQLIGLLRLLIA